VYGDKPDDKLVLGFHSAPAPGVCWRMCSPIKVASPFRAPTRFGSAVADRKPVVDDPGVAEQVADRAMAGSSAGWISLTMSPILRLRGLAAPSWR